MGEKMIVRTEKDYKVLRFPDGQEEILQSFTCTLKMEIINLGIFSCGSAAQQ